MRQLQRNDMDVDRGLPLVFTVVLSGSSFCSAAKVRNAALVLVDDHVRSREGHPFAISFRMSPWRSSAAARLRRVSLAWSGIMRLFLRAGPHPGRAQGPPDGPSGGVGTWKRENRTWRRSR